MSPMGMFTVKIHRQPIVDTNTAPRPGPTIAAIAHILPKKPCRRARWRKGKTSATTVKTSGWRQPAPMPWTARKAISKGIEGLAAQSADAPTNIEMPASKTRRRPCRSARRPQIGTVVVAVIR